MSIGIVSRYLGICHIEDEYRDIPDVPVIIIQAYNSLLGISQSTGNLKKNMY